MSERLFVCRVSQHFNHPKHPKQYGVYYVCKGGDLVKFLYVRVGMNFTEADRFASEYRTHYAEQVITDY